MDNREARSSSNDLSSAPTSDAEGPFANRPTSSHHLQAMHTAQDSSRLLHPSSSFGVSSIKSEAQLAQASATSQGTAPVKQRKPRKKKEVDPNLPEKEKKPRKPRNTATTTTTSRKKQKIENVDLSSIPQHVPQTNNLSASKLVEPAPFLADNKIVGIPEAAKYSQNGFSNHNSATNSQPQSPTFPRYQHSTPTPTPAPPVSRSVFDPVRSIALESSSRPPTYNTPLNETPPRPTTFRPSASPAISSIINPPEAENISTSSVQTLPAHCSAPQHSSINRVANLDGTSSNPMELDVPAQRETLTRKSSVADDRDASESDVKRKRAKEKPPPIPAGSGLLSSSFFGGESSIDKSNDGKGANIVIHIDIKKGENKVINFARMAEDKYGFAAMYPRQAAQKERLAKLAAAGAAIERSASNSKRGGSGAESGDDALSVDLDRESDNEGDVAMGGVNGTNENSGTDGPVPKQRRKRKDEEYDADDPFVDDSEMLWEAQAAASKDGFFVYCGPLVPEGEKVAVERADGTVKRGRGRGRGGGPGSRGGRGGATASTGTTAASGEATGRGGGGSGSRGGGVTRKPRITKAERAQREAEKKQREQMLAAKPPSVSAAS